MGINDISAHVVDAAMKVHRALGPGLLESAYQACMAYELRKRGLEVRVQLDQPIVYDDVHIDVGYRIDMLVENTVVVELKAIAKVLPIHQAQLLSYIKLGSYPLGLMFNFHERHLKNGITRMINK